VGGDQKQSSKSKLPSKQNTVNGENECRGVSNNSTYNSCLTRHKISGDINYISNADKRRLRGERSQPPGMKMQRSTKSDLLKIPTVIGS
jgi:hypothetical protein